LIATGAPLKRLGLPFGLSSSSIYNHSKVHISAEYRASVRLGPFQSEEHLRKLCAENGTSIVETLRAINGGVQARWLAAFEANAHDQFVDLTIQLRKNLELMARLTKELVPQPTTVVNTNNFMLFEHPEYVQAIASIAEALRNFPEARVNVARALRALGAADERLLIKAQPAAAG
jgi:hypothetical protein